MAEEYMTDDEQLEHVKRLAGEYGPWILGGVLIASIGMLGWRYYDNHRNDRAMQAAAQFSEMTSALQREDRTKARLIAGGLIDHFPGSPYADQAKLTLARLFVDEGQAPKAVAPLTDVIDHSKDAELKHIARLRLARVLIDQGKPDEALKALDDPPGPFAARYHEVRGDAFYAKKEFRQAATEYQTALDGTPPGGMSAALLTLKIADLGLPATAAAGAPTAKAKP